MKMYTRVSAMHADTARYTIYPMLSKPISTDTMFITYNCNFLGAPPPPHNNPTHIITAAGVECCGGAAACLPSIHILPGSRPKPLRPLAPHKANA